MKIWITALAVVSVWGCGTRENSSELDAVKGVGLFKDGYLYALSSAKDPSDRCWYYNSVFKNPFGGAADPKKDAEILRNAQPLTVSSVTSSFMADLISSQLQVDRNNQALSSGLAAGACAVAGTVTIPNPTAKVVSVVLCTGVKETFFQVLKNASDAAERGKDSVDRLGGRNDRPVVTIPKDAVNLVVNALRNNSGDGRIDSCAELKANLKPKDFDVMAGVRP